MFVDLEQMRVFAANVWTSGSQPFLAQVPVQNFVKSFVPVNICFLFNCPANKLCVVFLLGNTRFSRHFLIHFQFIKFS